MSPLEVTPEIYNAWPVEKQEELQALVAEYFPHLDINDLTSLTIVDGKPCMVSAFYAAPPPKDAK